MEAAAGFTHEAVVCIGIFQTKQALASGIDLAQGGSNRFAILSRNQGIGGTEHTGEARLYLRQQSQRGFTTTGTHPADACAVKIKGVLNPGQRGCQKGGMPPEAETHHVDGGVRVTDS